MGLWLETRDETGKLIHRARFFAGFVQISAGDQLSIEQAVKLARLSAHLPLEKRDWALRLELPERDPHTDG